MELLTVYLSAIDKAHFKVIVQSRMGEAEADSKLPFFETPDRWRTTLIKALGVNEFRASAFPQEAEQAWMMEQGWLGSDRQNFHPTLLARIGQAMYDALFPVGKVRDLLQRAIAQAEGQETQLHIQLKFSAEVTKRSRLPDYPWELAHDGQKFLAHHQIRFSRYIAHLATVPKLPAVEKLHVLLVSSGASDEENGLLPLSKREQKAVLKGLEKAQEEGHIQVEVLEPASLNQLRVYLTEHQPHVFHFDGHGVFGRRCNKDACRTIHKDLGAKQCKRCGADLPEPQGYLLFETEEDEADYVSAIELGELFQKTGFGDQPNQPGGVVVAVLSACKSGMALGGESVFNGVAQRLINHQLPAVVAMQYTVRVDGATQFAEQFYRSLGRKNSLATALSQGQEAMGSEGNQWYRPMLYLRWQDNEGGQLFAPEKTAPKVRIGVPFQAPPLPSYYVDRPEVSQDLKARLLQPTNGSPKAALMISAIHGLGAIGKSTVATALAHDLEIQSHFSDGILWTTLGQQPNLLSLLGGWIQALGDYNFQGTTVEASMAHLRTLLKEKTALLVVDDAWDASHAQAFLVGGTKCQVLITSRDKLIATSVGASLYSLDVMSVEQSLQLLAQRLGRSLTPAEQPEAKELAEEVGYLPLALELAATQIADGIAWRELLQDLRAEVAYLEALDLVGAEEIADEASSKRMSLRKSLNLSIRRLTDERRQQFAWFGVLPEDVIITPAMAATLWNLNFATATEREARDTLRYLRDKAILLDGVPLVDGTATYRLHDMFHDLAKNLLTALPTAAAEGQLAGLGLALSQAHAELLNRYHQKTQQQQWHMVPNDGYIHERLIWHLEQAGWLSEIHALLGETAASGRNGWYEARERLGQTAGYITDVHRALALLQQVTPEMLVPQMLGQQCRYALILSSLNSVANIPGELLVSLVKKQIWTPEQGLTYTRQLLDPQLRANNLTLLAEQLHTHLKQETLQVALEAVQKIENEENRAKALISLVDQLPSELLPIALEIAQSISMKDPEFRARALAALAYSFPDVSYQALEAAQAIRDDEDWLNTIEALADKLPPQIFRQDLKAAKAVGNKYYYFKALVALIDEQPEMLTRALEVAQSGNSSLDQFKMLLVLEDKLPEVLPQALEVTKSIYWDSDKSKALITLTDKLPLELLPQVLEVAQTIQDAESRFRALIALSNKLADVLPQAFESAQSIKNEKDRLVALASLVHKMPELLTQVFNAAQALEYKEYKFNVLAALADKLPSELLVQALDATQAIRDDKERFEALATLAKLTPNLLPQALGAAQAIRDDKERFEALATLAKLVPDLLPQALDAAQAIKDESSKSTALEALSDSLPLELLPQALEAAHAIKSDSCRFDALVALTNKKPELLPQALEAAKAIDFDFSRARALEILSDKLPPELLLHALKVAQTIKDSVYQTDALVALASKLPHELLPQVLEAVQGINEHFRFKVLLVLVDKLPEVLPQALEAVQDMWEDIRCEKLVALADKLPLDILHQTLENMQFIKDDKRLSGTLAVFADKLPSEILPQILEAALNNTSEKFQGQLLIGLADKLPLDLLPRALEAVQAIGEEFWRYQALVALTTKLPPELFPQALKIIQTIENVAYRSEALAALPMELPDFMLQALEAAQAAEFDVYRSRALTALADKLPIKLLPRFLEVVKTIRSHKDQFDILITLENHFPAVFPKALEAAQAIGDEHSRFNALALLAYNAYKLPPELLSQALQATQAIRDEQYRFCALRALADKRPEVLPQALEAAQAIRDEQYRSGALADLLPQLVQLSSVELYEFWFKAMGWLAALHRPSALQCWASLTPVIFTLGGREAVAEVANAITQVCRWWR